MNTPIITISEDLDSGEFTLLATSYLRTEPCGPRLFRGGDLPDVAFVHADAQSAERDRAALQRYVDLAWSGRAPRKKGAEEAEEKPAPEIHDAVWM